MSRISTDKTYLTTQAYADNELLNIRIRTHQHYSQPQLDREYTDLVLDLIDWQGDETVLDIGCGSGGYIEAVLSRLTAGGRLFAGDLSAGMLKETAVKKGFHSPEKSANLDFLNADAQTIPLPDEACDVVLANHMLYHVPDLPRALTDIRRILKPGGHLLAATNHPLAGRAFRDEVVAACRSLGHPLTTPSSTIDGFHLDNGTALISPVFPDLQRHVFESALVFPTAQPVVDYINSAKHYYGAILPSELTWPTVLEQVGRQVEAKIAATGEYRAPKSSGVFVATKERDSVAG